MRTTSGSPLGRLLLVGASASLLGCLDESPQANASGGSTNAVPGQSAPAVLPEPLSADPTVPEKLRELVTLIDAKVSDEVLLAFIARRETDLALTADEVVLLKNKGLGEGLIAILLRAPEPTAPVAEEATPPVATVAIPPKEPASPETAPTTAPTAPVLATNPVAVANPTAPTIITQMVTTVQAAQPVTVEYFTPYLEPHGTWITVAGYGRCWRPAIVVTDHNWKPYCHGGRWVWSDCGWYWQSDYSWGWATFHYGRWSRDRHAGWIWVPGDVWAPAWVSWRQSSDYCGWAPLPPGAHYSAGIGLTFRGRRVDVDFDFGLDADCHTFVPARRLDDHSWQHYRLGKHETSLVYRNTKPIHRFESGERGVIHRGIDREWFAKDDSRKRIPVRLDDLPDNGPAGRRSEIWKDEGRTLGIHRPKDIQSRPPRVAGPSRTEEAPSRPSPRPNRTPVAQRPEPVVARPTPPGSGALANPTPWPQRRPEIAAPTDRRSEARYEQPEPERPHIDLPNATPTHPTRPRSDFTARPETQRPHLQPKPSVAIQPARPTPANPATRSEENIRPRPSLPRTEPPSVAVRPIPQPSPQPSPQPVSSRATVAVPSQPTVHPRFQPATPAPAASPHPRFQAQPAPANPPSSHPRFQPQPAPAPANPRLQQPNSPTPPPNGERRSDR